MTVDASGRLTSNGVLPRRPPHLVCRGHRRACSHRSRCPGPATGVVVGVQFGRGMSGLCDGGISVRGPVEAAAATFISCLVLALVPMLGRFGSLVAGSASLSSVRRCSAPCASNSAPTRVCCSTSSWRRDTDGRRDHAHPVVGRDSGDLRPRCRYCISPSPGIPAGHPIG